MIRPGRSPRSLPVLALCLCLSPAGLCAAAAFDQAHSRLDTLLQTRVSEEGLVDYTGLAADRAELDAYLGEVAAVSSAEFHAWTRAEQMAFLLNAYNACTLHLIVDHWPVASIRDTVPSGDPWNEVRFPLLGREVTLNEIEHTLLRPVYHEPWIHFGLFCGARGCPPLGQRAFTAATLMESLEVNFRAFVNDPRFNDLSDPAHLRLSAIFEWYRTDFEEDAGSLVNTLQGFTATPLSPHAVIDFLPYDWNINGE